MKTSIKHFQTIFECEQFVVTGSTALMYNGLTHVANDLDIILVNPSEGTKCICERLQHDNPAATKPGGYGSVSYIFMHEGIKVDIFIRDTQVPYVECNGFSIATVGHIIAEKKKYDRLKDWVQLRGLSRMFFKPEEFETFLNKDERYEGAKPCTCGCSIPTPLTPRRAKTNKRVYSSERSKG